MAVLDPALQTLLRDIPTKRGPQRSNFRRAVVNNLWDKQYNLQQFSQVEIEYESYFELIYVKLCQAACEVHADASLEDTTNLDVLAVICTLRDAALLNKPPSQICDTSTERGKCLVRLAAGLLLPIRFAGESRVFSGEIDLDFDTPLKDLLKDHFTELLPAEPSVVCIPGDTCSTCGTVIDASHRIGGLGFASADDTSLMRFPRNFSAQQLEYIAGFKIGWTYNLLDHLRLIDTDNDLQLLLFHHVKQFDSLDQ